MRDNVKNLNEGAKTASGTQTKKVFKYSKASYFKEKDKKAAAFLKKNPIPGEFLK